MNVCCIFINFLFSFPRARIGVVFSYSFLCTECPSPLLLWHQDLAPEQLEENPIIFGDFIKVGASKDDRLYEEYSDQKKLRNALSEVGVSKGVSVLCKSMNKTHTHTHTIY